MQYIKFFNQISIKDVGQVGGKNASLGEMYRSLSRYGIKVPFGFATTAGGFFYFLDKTGIRDEIKKIVSTINKDNTKDLSIKGARIRNLILKANLPKDFQEEIASAYQKLSKAVKDDNLVLAVRSSATAEDLPGASFAGQQESYLNIKGEKQLLQAVKKCMASLFTNRAIFYREEKGFDHMSVGLSVGIHEMIMSANTSSGVMFTIDTESGFRNAIIINSIYGLGENIVQGRVDPDEFIVFKPTMTIIGKRIGKKQQRMIFSRLNKASVKNLTVSAKERLNQSITDSQVIKLAKFGMAIEKHYKKPMDIEWVINEKNNEPYIIQARPETIFGVDDKLVLEEYELMKKGDLIASGRSVGVKIGAGKAKIIHNLKEIENFKEGEVLVAQMTDPDWVPIMKKASAIVTDKGGRTCHAAIVSRELGIPCVVGTGDATRKIKERQEITVSCAEGDIGKAYAGKLPFKIRCTDVGKIKMPKTKIMMNIGDPDQAFKHSQIPNDGVGLAREEFIIDNYIKIHPLALINYASLKPVYKRKIDELTVGYDDKKDFFVDKLSQGIARIGAAFYPKDVILRFSDFKTNEYANLIGGYEFEPEEENPMLGWRGASRYYSPDFIEAFKMECQAVKRVREKMKLTNIKTMIPFCRSIEEAKKVLEIMKKNGLERGKNGFEVYMMVEIPSNIILADQFAKLFDGFSIGTNDLTQLVLGVDRDNHLVSHIYDENNQAVKDMVKKVIEIARKNKVKIGICGQAPSDYPEFAEFLVKCGIDSISLTPDTVVKTILRLSKK